MSNNHNGCKTGIIELNFRFRSFPYWKTRNHRQNVAPFMLPKFRFRGVWAAFESMAGEALPRLLSLAIDEDRNVGHDLPNGRSTL